MASAFGSISRQIIDRWVETPEVDRPEFLYSDIVDKIGIKSALNLINTEPESPLDWVYRSIKGYGFKTRIFDLGRYFPEGKLSQLQPSYMQESIIPAFSAVLQTKRPSIDRVKTRIAGVRIGYDRLIVPQKGEGKPRWCLTFTEGRFMFSFPQDEPRMDLVDDGIVQLLIEGMTAREISEMLNVSRRTVEHRIERMKDRFGARNLVHLVATLVALNVDGGQGRSGD